MMEDQNSTFGASRRDFIKKAALFSGGTLFAGGIGAYGEQITGYKVKLGIIGTGSRGQYLMNILNLIEGVEIVAICDNYEPNYKAGMLLARKAKGYSDYRKLLDDKSIEAVVIATPLHEHAHISINALHAGKHVFCEKSMARTIEDCYKMILAQRETGKILQIGHQRMFSEKYLKAIGMIKEGFIGEVTQIRAYWHRNNDWRRPVPDPSLERKINWRLYKEYSVGLMTELASHQVQIGDWIFDTHPESVMGSGSINYWHDGREVYDNVNLVYNYPNKVKLIYDSLISNSHYGLEEQIMGPKGTFELEIGKYYLETPPPAPGIIQLLHSMEKQFFESVPIGSASWIPETASGSKGYYIMDEQPMDDGTINQMKAFAGFVHEGKYVPGLAEAGYNATVSVLLGEKAMDTMETVYWPTEFKI